MGEALEFSLYMAGTAIVLFALVRRLGKISKKASDELRLVGDSSWRNSLPSATDVHVASVMQIAKERKASRINGAT